MPLKGKIFANFLRFWSRTTSYSIWMLLTFSSPNTVMEPSTSSWSPSVLLQDTHHVITNNNFLRVKKGRSKKTHQRKKNCEGHDH